MAILILMLIKMRWLKMGYKMEIKTWDENTAAYIKTAEMDFKQIWINDNIHFVENINHLTLTTHDKKNVELCVRKGVKVKITRY